MTNIVPLPRAGRPALAEDPPFDREVTEPAPERPGPAEDPPRGGGDGPPPAGPSAPGPRRFGRVVPLGTGQTRGKKAYVFLDADGDRVVFTARDLVQRSTLIGLFGGGEVRDTLADLWPEVRPRKGGKTEPTGDFDAEAAAAELIGACGAIGSADAVQLRLDGVWPHGDGLLVHAGDAILLREDGEDVEHPTGFRDGAAIYVNCAKRERPAEQPASAEDIARLGADLGLWTYAEEAREVAPQLLLGVIACGILGIAIPWRPHVFLRGETNAGKSSLARLISFACGAGMPAEDLTGPGLRRLFNNRSGLIPLDEREADAEGVAAVVRIMRGASDGEGNVTVQADTDGGGTAIFRVAGLFLMAATTLPALTAADASRITLLHLRRPDRDRRAEVEEAQARAKALHPALLQRMRLAWPRWRETWRVARAAAEALDATSRSADQVGALLAGWWLLTMDGDLTQRAAAAEMARFASFLTTRDAAREEGAGQMVLQHLLGSRIVVAERTSDQMTVQAALDRALRAQVLWQSTGEAEELKAQYDTDVERMRKALGAAGLAFNALGFSGRGWPWPFEDAPRSGLLIAENLPAVRNLFAGSDWPRLAWREPLLDLPGVLRSRRTMKFPSGGVSRAVFVPLAALGFTDAELRGDV